MATSQNPSLPDKSKEQELTERREKVNELLEKGWTEKKIAKHLNVSYTTIVRDVRYLKDQIFDWVDDLTKTGFTFEVRRAVGELNNLKSKLYGYLDDDKVNVSIKIKIIREIHDILDCILETLACGPTLQGLKKIVNRSGSPQTQPYNSS